MQVAVLNPSGRDPEQHFPDGAGERDDRVHAPVNYHAYAACTRSGFFRDTRAVPSTAGGVLVLLRRDLMVALRAVRELKERGLRVAVSWKESGLHQVEAQLRDAAAHALFREVCAEAHGALSSTPELAQFYRGAGARVVEFIPTPYAVDDARWDFSRPLSERTGIFIGTREWEVQSRQHESAVREALSIGVPVTVVNESGRAGLRRLEALGAKGFRVIERLPYTAYLAEMARCRVVFQRDASAVPGQVAGDALLCRMPCIGGNSAVEGLVFRDMPPLAELLSDDAAWERAVVESQKRALATLSFGVVAARLVKFFNRLAE